MTGSLLWSEIELITFHVDIGRNISPLVMTYTAIFLPGPGSIISVTLHTSMEYIYLPHLPNLTYIEKETYFLLINSLTAGSRPYNWRSWTNYEYTSKFTPSPTSPMGMAPTLTKGTMMDTRMNLVKPPTHDLLKDTQDQNNDNCGVRHSENSSQVIIPPPIFTKLVKGQIISGRIGHDSTIKNSIAFSLKLLPESSGKSINNCIHK